MSNLFLYGELDVAISLADQAKSNRISEVFFAHVCFCFVKFLIGTLHRPQIC